MRGYVICATPRSGSTLLCSLLRSTGVAGWPESWFRRPNRPEFAAEWQITRADGTYDWPDYLDAARRAGTTPNGVFGLRLMWNMGVELVADLGGAPLDQQAALLARTFGPLQFLHLTRDDLVAQAISRHRAEVSGTWHLGFEEALHPAEPQYDVAAIAAHLAEAQADNARWTDWFRANRITPHALTYETLAADPIAAATGVLNSLDLPDAPPPWAHNQRMADATSADWAARFRASAPDAAEPSQPT